MNKTFLRDGVYVEYDGYAVVLTTHNGVAVTNRIVLEPETYDDLAQYVEGIPGTPSDQGYQQPSRSTRTRAQP